MKKDQPLQSIIVIYVTRFLLPFIFAFGIYIQINSSDSPGGGFQAGVIMASGLILHSIIFGASSTLKIIPLNFLMNFTCLGMAFYLITGAVASILQKSFLDYTVFDNRFIQAQEVGIFLVELGVGFAVFSTICIIYYSFIQGDGAEK